MTGENALLEAALSRYDLRSPVAKMIRHSENRTYRVEAGNSRYALRIHVPAEGFRASLFAAGEPAAARVAGELELLSRLSEEGEVPVQSPIRGRDGALAQSLADGAPVSLLTWLDGETVEEAGELTPPICAETGRTLARLHAALSRHGADPRIAGRTRYDASALPILSGRIDAAEGAGVIDRRRADSMRAAIREIGVRFAELDAASAPRLVHADFGRGNAILLPDGRIAPIDFGLRGLAHPEMDLGGVYGLGEADGARRMILDAYARESERPADPRSVEPYHALNILLFVASRYERAAGWDWFPGKLSEWAERVFKPLAEGRRFLAM